MRFLLSLVCVLFAFSLSLPAVAQEMCVVYSAQSCATSTGCFSSPKFKQKSRACHWWISRVVDFQPGTPAKRTVATSEVASDGISCAGTVDIVYTTGDTDTGNWGIALDQGEMLCSEYQEPFASKDEYCEGVGFSWNASGFGLDRSSRFESTRDDISLNEQMTVCMPYPSTAPGAGSPDAPLGCKHEFTPTSRFRQSDDSNWIYEGDSWAIGGGAANISCNPGLEESIPAVDKDPPCKGIPGQVNGIDVCLDKSSGQQQGVDWTQVKDADGKIRDVKTDVKCVGEKCTVITTSKDATGDGGSVVATSLISRGQYCANNPKSSVCAGKVDKSGSTRGQEQGSGSDGGDGDGEGSSFGGSCVAGFTCDGDAIQCAMAREQHIRNCKLIDDPPDPVYAAAVDGSDGKDAESLRTDASQVSVGGFDQAGYGWGSSCPADPEIPLGFTDASFVIPFSRICGPLSVFSLAGVGITLLGALLWVLGGRKES